MPLASPTLLRRAAPAPAATAPAAVSPLHGQQRLSPPSPRFPPGFPTPRFAREDLILSLFPQLAGSTPDPVSPPRCPPSSGSSLVRDPVPEDPPAVAAPVASGPIRKVRFAAAEDLLHPAPVRLVRGAPRSCLKASSAVAFGAGRRAARTPVSSCPSPPRASPIAPSCGDASLEEGWKLVRAPYWWRALSPIQRLPRRRSSPSYSPPTGRIFVKLHRRTCHRCLERGHCKVDCRDPYKCLICRQSGHRARQCTSKLLSPPQDCLPPPPPPQDRLSQLLLPSPDDAAGRTSRRTGPCSQSWLGVRQPSRAPSGRADNRGQDSLNDCRRDGRDTSGCQEDDKFRGLELPILDARKINAGCVQRLRDGTVIPASGRRSRDRPADRTVRCARPQARCDSLLNEESRGRSPPSSPRTTHHDIIVLRPSLTAPGNCGRSSPPSPRTTHHDIIELRRSPSASDWLRRAAPCLGLQVSPEDAPPGWPARSPPRLLQRESSSTPSPLTPLLQPVLSPGSLTPLHQQASSAGSSDELMAISTPEASPSPPVTPIHIPMSTPPGSPAVSPPHSPLFIARQPPLLADPSSTPLRPQTARRRKTLAGVSGFNLTRCSPRLQAKKRAMPIAQMAERLLCQRMGIIDEGQELTEDAIGKFVAMFQGRLPDITISALRALFNLDCDLAKAVEDALVEHGGEAGPELQSTGVEVADEAA